MVRREGIYKQKDKMMHHQDEGLVYQQGSSSSTNHSSLDAEVSGHSSSAGPLANITCGAAAWALARANHRNSNPQQSWGKVANEGNGTTKKANVRRYYFSQHL